jgi:glycosyltransferase involved in cell wall biosynthesis
MKPEIQQIDMTIPRVSIVVPVYNGVKYLEECLNSIAAQTYQDWEAVVVNNCSTDGTAAIIDKFVALDSRFRAMHCQEFVPKPDNYNRAIACASKGAEFVKIVEADNSLRRECIARMVKTAELDPDIGIVGCYYLEGSMLKGSGARPDRTVIPGRDVRRDHLLNNNVFICYYLGVPTTLLFRAKALADAKPHFRAELFFDDQELCFRILARWKFGFVHDVLAIVREGNGFTSQILDFDTVAAYQYALLVRFGEDVLTPDEYRRTINVRKRAYFKRIGRAVLVGRSQRYWDVHRGVFRFLGKELSLRTLLVPAAMSAIDGLFNPKSTIERLVRRRHSFAFLLERLRKTDFGRLSRGSTRSSDARAATVSSLQS